MTMEVDFYYGLGSRYSYLASTRIARIEQGTGASFRWRPLSSRALIGRRSHDPFQGEPVSGQYDWGFRRRDAEAWAAYYGVPFNEPVGRLDHDPHLPALAAIAARRQGTVVEMSHRLFRLVFVDDRRSFGRDEIVAEAVAAGLDRARFEADLDSAGVDDEHERELAAAAGRGVFGVPTFLVGERLFWGNDRLPLVEAAIRGAI